MGIFGMRAPELLIILAAILLIFGPKNLPKLGASLGKTVKNLREGMSSEKEETAEMVEFEEDEEEVVEEEPAPKTRTVKRTVKAKKDAE